MKLKEILIEKPELYKGYYPTYVGESFGHSESTLEEFSNNKQRTMSKLKKISKKISNFIKKDLIKSVYRDNISYCNRIGIFTRYYIVSTDGTVFWLEY